jgi:diguanylate cyclase (GGDEF)-like protein/PAS domain S-box-containing protein
VNISHEFFQTALGKISDAVILVRVITEGDVTVDFEYHFVNEAYERFVGNTKERMIGKKATELFPDMDIEKDLRFLDKVALEDQECDIEHCCELTGKRYKVTAYSYDKGYFVLIFSDLEKNIELAQKHQELLLRHDELNRINREIEIQKALLREKNEILELIMSSGCDGVWYINPITGQKEISSKFLRGCSAENQEIPAWESLIHPEDYNHTTRLFQEFLDGKIEDYIDEYRVKSEDGTYRWLRSSGRSYLNENGKPYLLAGMHIDIHSMKMHEDRLAYIAYHDNLTGLPNRKLFFDRLDITLKKAKRLKEKVAVLFFDIDNFKKINDSMGHDSGDEILRQSAGRISSRIRDYDTLARLGGDEFVLSFQNVSTNEEILTLTQRVKECFLEPFVLGKNIVHLNCSIGISVFPDHGKTNEELLKYADMAMYKAKECGKNKVQLFSSEIAEEVFMKFDMEKGLRKAIEKEEFELFYQPQYDIETGKIRGVEALLRWNNPFQGYLGPEKFIKVAEETGLIIHIGEWVIKQACETANNWRSLYNFQGIVSVNISAVQLRNSDIVNTISTILSETGFPASSLELEISENTFVDCLDETITKMAELKKMGVKISLDNFGKGYSSLGYLRRIPIHVLKIDKSFVDEINPSYQGKKIVSSIISLAQDLEIDVIAEGIETSEQYNYLKQARCGFIQGHYTSKPIPEEMMGELIRRN